MEVQMRNKGWNLSAEGFKSCRESCNKSNPTLNDIIKEALNNDLRHIGQKHLPETINSGQIESIKGPIVLQVQKIRNLSAPMINQESSMAPRMIKLNLTDGHTTCTAIEFKSVGCLDLNIIPGVKINMTSADIPLMKGVILLEDGNVKVLGGEVEALKSKWETNKQAKNWKRTADGEGPPPYKDFDGSKPLAPTRHKGRSDDWNPSKTTGGRESIKQDCNKRTSVYSDNKGINQKETVSIDKQGYQRKGKQVSQKEMQFTNEKKRENFPHGEIQNKSTERENKNNDSYLNDTKKSFCRQNEKQQINKETKKQQPSKPVGSNKESNKPFNVEKQNWMSDKSTKNTDDAKLTRSSRGENKKDMPSVKSMGYKNNRDGYHRQDQDNGEKSMGYGNNRDGYRRQDQNNGEKSMGYENNRGGYRRQDQNNSEKSMGYGNNRDGYHRQDQDNGEKSMGYGNNRDGYRRQDQNNGEKSMGYENNRGGYRRQDQNNSEKSMGYGNNRDGYHRQDQNNGEKSMGYENNRDGYRRQDQNNSEKSLRYENNREGYRRQDQGYGEKSLRYENNRDGYRRQDQNNGEKSLRYENNRDGYRKQDQNNGEKSLRYENNRDGYRRQDQNNGEKSMGYRNNKDGYRKQDQENNEKSKGRTYDEDHKLREHAKSDKSKQGEFDRKFDKMDNKNSYDRKQEKVPNDHKRENLDGQDSSVRKYDGKNESRNFNSIQRDVKKSYNKKEDNREATEVSSQNFDEKAFGGMDNKKDVDAIDRKPRRYKINEDDNRKQDQKNADKLTDCKLGKDEYHKQNQKYYDKDNKRKVQDKGDKNKQIGFERKYDRRDESRSFDRNQRDDRNSYVKKIDRTDDGKYSDYKNDEGYYKKNGGSYVDKKIETRDDKRRHDQRNDGKDFRGRHNQNHGKSEDVGQVQRDDQKSHHQIDEKTNLDKGARSYDQNQDWRKDNKNQQSGQFFYTENKIIHKWNQQEQDSKPGDRNKQNIDQLSKNNVSTPSGYSHGDEATTATNLGERVSLDVLFGKNLNMNENLEGKIKQEFAHESHQPIQQLDGHPINSHQQFQLTQDQLYLQWTVAQQNFLLSQYQQMQGNMGNFAPNTNFVPGQPTDFPNLDSNFQITPQQQNPYYYPYNPNVFPKQ